MAGGNGKARRDMRARKESGRQATSRRAGKRETRHAREQAAAKQVVNGSPRRR